MNAQEMVGFGLLALGLLFSLIPTCLDAVHRKSYKYLGLAPAMLIFWYQVLLALFWGLVVASFGAFYPAALWLSQALVLPWRFLIAG